MSDMIHTMVKNSVDTISDMENELAEMKAKYEKLLTFVKAVRNMGCCNLCSCMSCDALDLLREIKECQ